MTRAAALADELLPPSIRRLVAAIGVGPTLALLEARGGTEIVINKEGMRSDLLTGLIGKTAAGLVIQLYAERGRVMLPMPDKLLIAARNREIAAAHDQGVSAPTLALRYRLTVRQVQNVCASARSERLNAANDENAPPARGAQGDLFR